VSIGAAVSVNGTTISNSVLLEQSSISGHGAITDSIVGKRSLIKTLPNTVSRVILGDDCDVTVGS
jgi:NDP-sugar pyrophosphorylase family protein